MPVPQRVQYSAEIEPLVQFIEDTPPSDILDRTLEKLRGGIPIPTMLTASALAVTRSTEMPPGHHGGPLHPQFVAAGRTTRVQAPENRRPLKTRAKCIRGWKLSVSPVSRAEV